MYKTRKNQKKDNEEVSKKEHNEGEDPDQVIVLL